MKKTLLTLVALVAFLAGSIAQNVGVRIGGTMADFQKDFEYTAISNPTDVQGNLGLNVALFGEMPLAGGLVFQPELQYVEKGARIWDRGHVKSYMINKWRYLSVPLLLKYRATTPKGNFFVYGGPEAGYAISGTTVYSHWLDPNSDAPTRFSDEVKYTFDTDQADDGVKDNRFDAGFAVGGGVEFMIGKGYFSVDVRYGFDPADNQVFDGDPVGSNQPAQNRVFGLSVGYSIPLLSGSNE